MQSTHDQHSTAVLALIVGEVASVSASVFGYVLAVFLLEEFCAPPLNPLQNFGGFSFWVMYMAVVGAAIGASFAILATKGLLPWTLAFAMACYVALRLQGGLIAPFRLWDTVCFAQVVVLAVLYIGGAFAYLWLKATAILRSIRSSLPTIDAPLVDDKAG